MYQKILSIILISKFLLTNFRSVYLTNKFSKLCRLLEKLINGIRWSFAHLTFLMRTPEYYKIVEELKNDVKNVSIKPVDFQTKNYHIAPYVYAIKHKKFNTKVVSWLQRQRACA